MIGDRLGHYKIVGELGVGGMGEVYLADDTKLHRKVAVKVLPPELAGSPERLERFQREATTLAALDHPNIVTIHSIEEAAGVRFLTMAYVEGQTLGELIPSGGLPLERCLELAVSLADGLRAAHQRGIVHRDLKPANVMVDTEGRLRILDFGLAKLQPESYTALSSQLATETMRPAMTREGTIVGTYPYMSPEQAEGKPADSSSDLFSFGVVLYEMATGERPFEGETPASLISSILKDSPKPLLEARPELPRQLGEIVGRCLEKEPARRFQSARELHDALAELWREVSSGAAVVRRFAVRPLLGSKQRRMAALAAAVAVALVTGLLVWRAQAPRTGKEPRIASLAVLPLHNLSADPEQEYFVDGMTEALITDLSKIAALRVISRSSSMRYKGTDKPLEEIARELDVDAVVEGSVVREGDRVGITAQLIEAGTDQMVWADRFERELRSILALQGEIARTVARQIEVTLTPEEETLLTETREVEPEAYEAYLKGTFHLNKLTPKGIETGLGYLRQAIDKDPASPLAYAGLALGYSLVASHSPSPPADAFERAQAAYRKALELDETLAEAHAALAEAKLYREWDWEGSAKAFRRALELNPNLARAHAQYAWYLNLMGRQDEAVAEMRRAQQVDPLTPVWTAWIGDLHATVGQYDETIVAAREALELNPDFPWAFFTLGWGLAGSGSWEEAIAAHEKAVELDPGFRGALAVTYAMSGVRDEALQIAAELKRKNDPGNTFSLVLIYVALGDGDEALRWIEAAIEHRHPFAPWLFRNVEVVDLLGDDLRYRDLRERLGIAPPQPRASLTAA